MEKETLNLIEAVLFWQSEPITVKKLAGMVKVSIPELESRLAELATNLETRGVRLVRKDDEVTLATAPNASTLIQELTKEELTRELGKAGLETLAIVLYQGPITRSEIDYVRGVNSSFILRNLSIRGLVERISDPKDERRFLYRPTFELLTLLGISKISDLPEYGAVKKELEAFQTEKATSEGKLEAPEQASHQDENNQNATQ
ncbi:MAG: SMC-Scp complex subunit ScpB [Candidatus Paceibacterota bacterium]|jgi:segregation and condensation protein B